MKKLAPMVVASSSVLAITSKNLHLENLVVSAVCGNMMYEAL